MALPADWTIDATPSAGGDGESFVRDRNSKRPREVDAKPLQIVPPTEAMLGAASLGVPTSLDDATTIIDDNELVDATEEDDTESMCSECRWLFDKEAEDEPLLTSANDLMFDMVPRIQFYLKKLTEHANSLNLQKALFECAY